MKKFTTKQLQNALLVLKNRNDEDSNKAFRIAFDELESRMGEDQFDAWLDANGI